MNTYILMKLVECAICWSLHLFDPKSRADIQCAGKREEAREGGEMKAGGE